jgi:hypothetical protein
MVPPPAPQVLQKGDRMSIPLKDALLVPYSTNMNDRIVASPSTYQLLAAQAAAYTAVHEPYIAAQSAMMAARADGTRSEAATATRNACKTALLTYARMIYSYVQNNAAISDADKILLGVRVRSLPTPIPRPDVRPGTEVAAVDGRTVTFLSHDSASPTKRGKPPACTGAFVYSFVGDDYPTDPAAWAFEGSTTQRKFKIVFPGTVEGGTRVWLCAAWINAKQEAGPVSVPVPATIQFGGVGAAGNIKMAA